MLRGFAIGVFILAFPTGIFCQQNNPIGRSSQEDRERQTIFSKASGNDQAVCCCGTAPSSGSSNAMWYSALERPDWWVVIIAALTGLAVAWQSLETRRAVQAMRASNQAYVRSQRARLTIRPEHRDYAPESRRDRDFLLIAENFGQSIAEILEIDTKLVHFGPEIFKHLETMDFPAPTANILREPEFLLAGGRWQFAQLTMGEVVEPGWEAATEEGRRIPVWYGWIKFRDLSGEVHRRRFFFMFSGRNRTFHEVGPEGWNAED
jgi:hypothetical protein